MVIKHAGKKFQFYGFTVRIFPSQMEIVFPDQEVRLEFVVIGDEIDLTESKIISVVKTILNHVIEHYPYSEKQKEKLIYRVYD